MDITLEEAIERLLNGEVIGVPTDTVYGLSSLRQYGHKIFEVKQRDHSKKLITMVNNVDELEISDNTLRLKMEEVWPGKVTLIYEVDGELTSYRIPNEPNLLRLLGELGKPIFTTSANISGSEPCLTREEFKQTFPTIGLLEETEKSQKSSIPSEIYIYDGNRFERIR